MQCSLKWRGAGRSRDVQKRARPQALENSAENMRSVGSCSALNAGQRIAEWCGRSTAKSALCGDV